MAKSSGHTLGIDVGGSGIKGAPVDLKKGDLASKRKRIATPQPATPEAVGDVVAQLIAHFADEIGDEPVGVTMPAVVRHGVVGSAANIDTDADALFTTLSKRNIHVINDADAAGVAEARFGAAKGQKGLVILTTLGTGIGTALIYDGVLVPNSELGHLEIDGHDAETQAASSVKDKLELSYADYIPRLQRYYDVLEALLSPDLIVVGGGISKESDQFLPMLKTRAKIVPATLRNQAGIIGAAIMAHEQLS